MNGARRIALPVSLGGMFLVFACATFEWLPVGPRRTAPVEGASLEGEKECQAGECHVEVGGRATIASYHSDCEACHGGGSLHNVSEDPLHTRFPTSQECIDCHGVGFEHQMQWETSEHARAGLLCSDCHTPHGFGEHELRAFEQSSLRDLDPTSSLCVECHRDVAARLSFPSHHPVAEGALSCSSCHDAHEDQRVALGDQNQRCVSCHQDFMGPWVFEHPPAVENCMTCHNPHGAVTQNLLEVMEPVVCLSCHSLADNRHHNTSASGIPGQTVITRDRPTAPGERITSQEAGAFLRRCSDCHTAVHGSYTDEHLRH